MKLIIAGSRHLDIPTSDIDRYVREAAFEDPVTEVVCGMARGVDYTGYLWARFNGIPIAEFEANWEGERLAAGPIRNRRMAQYADCALVILEGVSKGSRNMIKEMAKLKKRVHVVELPPAARSESERDLPSLHH